MKKLIFLLTILSVLASGCKLLQKPAQAESEYTADNTAETKVFTVPEAPPITAKPVTNPVVETKPIAVRKEQVSFTSQSEQSANAGNTFFVIIGSFGQLDNAKNYRTTLVDEGFTPIILHSETGYYRVCVNSYKSETEARSRVSQVRQAFPKYSDVWLLIKE